MLLESFKLEIWIALIIFTFILGFIQIYGFYTFKAIQNLIIIKKRYPTMVLIECYASMILLFIGIPLWVHSMFEAQQTQSDISWIELFIEYAGFIIIVYTAHFITNIEAARLWLMYYDLNYLHSSKNQVWKSQINKSFAGKDWYLQNKIKYGNKQYIIRRVFIYYIFAATISSIIFIILNGEYLYFAQFIDSMLLSVPTTWSIYIYYKCPKDSNDAFLFLYEFRNTAILFATGFIIYFINQIIHFCGFPVLNITLIAFDAVFAMALPSLMSTWWIPRQILAKNIWKPQRVNSRKRINSVSVSTKNEKLSNILKNEKKFEEFVYWMYREFSSETILCFIELIQFKQLTSSKGSDELKKKKSYSLYENIPKSSIIYMNRDGKTCIIPITSPSKNVTNIDDIDHFKNIAHSLYIKYIKTNAELEVNISSELRDTYYILDKNNYDQVEITKFCILFDDVIEEMFIFMIHSFTRFVHQEHRFMREFSITPTEFSTTGTVAGTP